MTTLTHEKDFNMKAYITAAVISLTLAAAYVTGGSKHHYDTDALAQKYESALSQGLDRRAVKVMKENGCWEPVLVYMETGKWDDAWCANNYALVPKVRARLAK